MHPALDKRLLRRRFERAANVYDGVAVVQRRMADELVDRLDVVKLDPGRVLDAGCGTGYALPGLARRFPGAEFVLIDLATEMLRRANQRGVAQVRPVCADVELMPVRAQSVDVIFCNATLEWCDLDHVLTEFLRVLKPEGLLTFATFGPDTLMELRSAWRQVDPEVDFRRFVDMHDIGDALVHRQFTLPVMDVDRVTVTHREFEGVLRDLKSVGVGNALGGRRRGLGGKRVHHAVRRAFEEFRNADGLLQTTCEIVYGHAWAPTQIRLDDAAGGVAVPVNGLRRR